jgi:uncharacterized protein (DUF58 family)
MMDQEISSTIRKIDIFTSRKVSEAFSGNYKSSFKGAGIEVSDIREYEEGEDVRNIDWITTARQGKPFVKKYQETRELTTLLVLDLSSSMDFGTKGRTKQETALELCSILLFSALKNNDKFGAILYADKIEKYIPPKKGKAHLLRIVREIVVRAKGKERRRGEQKQALDFLNSVIKRHAICFFVSDGISAEAEKALKISERKFDLVFARIFDRFEEGIETGGIYRIEDPESGRQLVVDLGHKETRERYRAIRQEKILGLRQLLRRYNIDTLELSTESDVYKELLRFFRLRQLRY